MAKRKLHGKGNSLAFHKNLSKWSHVCNTWRREYERYCHEILHFLDVLVNLASIFVGIW